MNTVVASVAHGIIFILDPKNEDILCPTYIETQLVATTESCISLAVQPEVDGDVEISIIRADILPANLLRVAVADLLTPHGSLAVSTASDDEPLVECRVPIGMVSLSVWVDDIRFPARVVVNIEETRPA